jgi:anti-anti-sigma regulatory factor
VDFQVSTATIDGKGGLIVSVEGELDIATVEQLAEPVGVAVADGRHLVLDLSHPSKYSLRDENKKDRRYIGD